MRDETDNVHANYEDDAASRHRVGVCVDSGGGRQSLHEYCGYVSLVDSDSENDRTQPMTHGRGYAQSTPSTPYQATSRKPRLGSPSITHLLSAPVDRTHRLISCHPTSTHRPERNHNRWKTHPSNTSRPTNTRNRIRKYDIHGVLLRLRAGHRKEAWWSQVIYMHGITVNGSTVKRKVHKISQGRQANSRSKRTTGVCGSLLIMFIVFFCLMESIMDEWPGCVWMATG